MKETFFLEIGSGESDNLQKLILKCIMLFYNCVEECFFLVKTKKKETAMRMF